MTENDRKLIKRAEKMQWEQISNLEDLADTEEARRELHQIAVCKYHYDEARHDMI